MVIPRNKSHAVEDVPPEIVEQAPIGVQVTNQAEPEDADLFTFDTDDDDDVQTES